METEKIVVISYAVLLVVLLGMDLYILRYLRFLRKSFPKMAHLVREDTKLYFQESADKAVEMSKRLNEEHTAALAKALDDSQQKAVTMLEGLTLKAQDHAAQAVIQAQKEAENIRRQGEEEVRRLERQTVDRSALALEWALRQYVKKEISLAQHEQLIRQFVTEYLNEN